MGIIQGAAVEGAMKDLQGQLREWRRTKEDFTPEELLAKLEAEIESIRKSAHAGWY